MHPALWWPVVGSSLVLAGVGLVTSLAGRTAGRIVLGAAALAEALALVQSVVAGIGLLSHPVPSAATFVGYLVGNALVLPFAVAWAWADRNRWSGAVVAVGGLTVAVMTARLLAMWAGQP